MSFVGSVAGGVLKGRAKRQGRIALLFAAVSIGYRVFRRLTRLESRPAIRFEVKPGEIYELRGLRRDR
jgi:hypothetical protein